MELHGLSGHVLDQIEGAKGKLQPAMKLIASRLRSLDRSGTFSQKALEDAFQRFDDENNNKFSKASKKSPSVWAKDARIELRKELSKENKRANSQLARDNAKRKAEGQLPQTSPSTRSGTPSPNFALHQAGIRNQTTEVKP